MDTKGFPSGTSSKEPDCYAGAAGDGGLIPGLGRFPGGGHGNPLQYSCLENLMDRRVWQGMVHRVAKSRTRLKWLGTHTHTHLDYQGGKRRGGRSWEVGINTYTLLILCIK